VEYIATISDYLDRDFNDTGRRIKMESKTF